MKSGTMGAVAVAQDEQPISRTYQYRKVMKPMLERKRRARINRCLDELKELLVGALQAEGESVSRLEKADVLELTVRHLHKLRRSQQLSENSAGERFRQGFVHCANEVSKYISTSLSSSPPGVPLDISVSSRIVTHLDQCIRQIESSQIHHHQQLIHQGGSHPGGPSMVPPQGSPPSQLSPVNPSNGYHHSGPSPPGAPVSLISPAGSTASGGSGSNSSSGGGGGGGLNILTSYTPPSSPINSPSNSSNPHHHQHHQKIYYIPSSSLAGSSSASSTGSLSPIPPAHYNPISLYNSAHHGGSQQPLSLCTKSPNPEEPFDLSNNMWRPW